MSEYNSAVGWQQLGACAGHPDPEAWFPISQNDTAETARDTCGSCPVRLACAQSAVAARDTNGIWAGFRLDQADERQALRMWLIEQTGTPAQTCIECGAKFVHTGKMRHRKCKACWLGNVSPEQCRDHLASLLAHLTLVEVAELTGVERHTLGRIADGRQESVKQSTVDAIMSIELVGSAAPA
ncbi:WhiB family transcriptional regulator [Nocardia cyriacigeorgica]|uniref:WhiB family transcriptional regulator n=1 Tax=Nocardia cyriacigeorgica TaxID=135487 RepID=UPI001486F62A|nr:WhiB family transcriptional regulator [Nocardia cyriacigeorgica]